MPEQNFEALFGPKGKSDYSVGDRITFTEQGQTFTGEIIGIEAPGRTVTGRPHPTQYWVDAGDGFPHCVYSSQLVVR